MTRHRFVQLTVESVFGVFGWNDASETFNVTLEPARRGYTEAQIEKLWATGNLLRVMDQVQRIAAELQN